MQNCLPLVIFPGVRVAGLYILTFIVAALGYTPTSGEQSQALFLRHYFFFFSITRFCHQHFIQTAFVNIACEFSVVEANNQFPVLSEAFDRVNHSLPVLNAPSSFRLRGILNAFSSFLTDTGFDLCYLIFIIIIFCLFTLPHFLLLWDITYYIYFHFCFFLF